MPVDRISGRPLLAVYSMSGRSTSSNDAILNAATSSASSSSTAARSNGLERNSMPASRLCAARIGCHSRGSATIFEQLVRGLGAELAEIVEARRLGGVERAAGVGLELDRVGTGLGGDVDEPARDIEITIVVGARFRDHVARMTGTDLTVAEPDRHRSLPTVVNSRGDDGHRFEDAGHVFVAALLGLGREAVQHGHRQEAHHVVGGEVLGRFHRQAVHEHRVRLVRRAPFEQRGRDGQRRDRCGRADRDHGVGERGRDRRAPRAPRARPGRRRGWAPRARAAPGPGDRRTRRARARTHALAPTGRRDSSSARASNGQVRPMPTRRIRADHSMARTLSSLAANRGTSASTRASPGLRAQMTSAIRSTPAGVGVAERGDHLERAVVGDELDRLGRVEVGVGAQRARRRPTPRARSDRSRTSRAPRLRAPSTSPSRYAM